MRLILLLITFLIVQLTNGQPLIHHVVTLPKELKETSALVFYNGAFWTINDSGGEAMLYQVSRKGEIIRRVTVKNAKNVDWEALAINNSHLFIGDFGNNLGSRDNLSIYALSLEELEKNEAIVDFTIEFNYPEQTEWIKTKWNTEFDCEAMLATDSLIHLFTKDWKTHESAHYTLQIKHGAQDAKYTSSIKAEGLVTDATWDKNGGLYLLGYRDYIPFINRYTDLNDLTKKEKYIFIGNYKFQVEGIAFVNDTLYITTEKSAIDASLLYFLPPN